MAGKRIERDEEKHGYVWRRDVLILFLVIGLSLSAIAYAYYAPMVEEVPLEPALTEGGTGGTAAIAGVNESEEVEIRESEVNKFWREWKIYNKSRFQYYVDRTEIEWFLQPKEGGPVGKIFVDGELLYNGSCNKSERPLNPLDYFENKSRKGVCVHVAYVSYELLKTKGEDVRVMSAENIDYNKEYAEKYPGVDHDWTEYTDSKGQKLVIDFNIIWSRKDWYTRYNWTVDLRQFEPYYQQITSPLITKPLITPTPPV